MGTCLKSDAGEPSQWVRAADYCLGPIPVVWVYSPHFCVWRTCEFCNYLPPQEILDADDNPLKNKYGEKMSRDIVQFVPLREFKSKTGANFSLVCTCRYVDGIASTR